MPLLIYSAVFYLLTPLVCLRLLWRGRKVPGYRKRWRERFGFIPPVGKGSKVIWVHAVSVGETIAAAPLVKQLQRRYPQALIAVTTTTPTGSERVVAMLGESVYHCYAPYDLPGANGRFLSRLKPDIAIVMETELWPNLVNQCYRRRIPLMLANARLSEKSAQGYRRFPWLTSPMMEKLTMVAAQNREDGERFEALGVSPQRIQITGNIKFDLEITDVQREDAERLGKQWRGENSRSIWLAASTHRGEDQKILTAFRKVLEQSPQTLLVLVPRHPDRFNEVAQLCGASGFSVVRRSEGVAPSSDIQVLLGDSMGELPLFFGACDVAFVAGSLVPVGGHNLLEPAVWGVPVLSGPSLYNFSEISSLLKANDALEICTSEDELSSAVVKLLSDLPLRQRRGRAACEVVAKNRGAMEKLLTLIATLWE